MYLSQIVFLQRAVLFSPPDRTGRGALAVAVNFGLIESVPFVARESAPLAESRVLFVGAPVSTRVLNSATGSDAARGPSRCISV